MATRLTSTQQTTLQSASEQKIQEIFLKNKRYNIVNQNWLGKGNHYRENVTKKIERDLKTGARSPLASSPEKQKSLAQYISVSTLLHASDGWNFLGKAIVAHSKRDRDISRHMGYYAELRATMAILASVGIGIFDRKHFVYNSTDRITQVPGGAGTHFVSWLYLAYWDEIGRSSKLIGDVITPGGIKLSMWHDFFNSGTVNLLLIQKEWLKDWGLDMERLIDDRDARNESSYRPTRLINIPSLDVKETSDFLVNIWKVCQTSGILDFEYIDRHLLRESLEKVYHATTGITDPPNNPQYQQKVRNMVNSLPSLTARSAWESFLLRRTDPSTSEIINFSKGTAAFADTRHHLEVLSRAVLLLRLAQGACRQMATDTNITRDDLEFWWKPFGEERGLWEPGNPPNPFSDLWADIDDALRNLSQWNIDNPTTPQSFLKWRKDCLQDISTLGEFERVALWGLGI